MEKFPIKNPFRCYFVFGCTRTKGLFVCWPSKALNKIKWGTCSKCFSAAAAAAAATPPTAAPPNRTTPANSPLIHLPISIVHAWSGNCALHTFVRCRWQIWKLQHLKLICSAALSVQKEIELLGQRAVVFALIATTHTVTAYTVRKRRHAWEKCLSNNLSFTEKFKGSTSIQIKWVFITLLDLITNTKDIYF